MGWLIAGAAAILVAALGLYLLDRAAVRLLDPGDWPQPETPEQLSLPFVDVSFPSGPFELRGWLLQPEAAPGRTAVVVVHGWGANAGEMLKVAGPLAEAGHPVLAFDVRSHGRSPRAPFLTAGQYRDDVAAACRWLAEREPERPRVVVGHSMGGATAVLAAVEGAPVDGVCHVAAPADLLEVLAGYFSRRGLPGRLTVRALAPFWRRRAGVRSFQELQPEARAPELDVPLLVVAASEDRQVPPGHAERMRGAPDVRVRVVEGARHFDLLRDPALFEELLSFLGRLEAVPTGRPAP